MLRIAICDDDNNAVETHKKIAETCLMQSGSAGKIAVYTTSGNLLYDITEDGFFFFERILMPMNAAPIETTEIPMNLLNFFLSINMTSCSPCTSRINVIVFTTRSWLNPLT